MQTWKGWFPEPKGLKEESTEKKSGQRQTAPEGIAGNAPQHSGHESNSDAGRHQEAERDEEQGRNLSQSLLHDTEGAAPDQGSENQGQVRLNRFRNSHSDRES